MVKRFRKADRSEKMRRILVNKISLYAVSHTIPKEADFFVGPLLGIRLVLFLIMI